MSNHSLDSLAIGSDMLCAKVERLLSSITLKDLGKLSKGAYSDTRSKAESTLFVMDVLEDCSREDIAEIIIKLILAPNVEIADTTGELEEEIAELKGRLDTIRWEAEY